MQQDDTLFQVNEPVRIVAQNDELWTSQGRLSQRDDTVVAPVAWVGGQDVTLSQSDTGRGREHERPG